MKSLKFKLDLYILQCIVIDQVAIELNS